MDILYALFQKSYAKEPIIYRLGKNYTVQDVVKLFSKAHTITLTDKDFLVELEYSYGSVVVAYDTKRTEVRLVDALYVIDKLLSIGYILLEEALTISNLPGDLQRNIYSIGGKETLGVAQQLNTTIATTTKEVRPEACYDGISIGEVTKWLKHQKVGTKVYILSVESPTRFVVYNMDVKSIKVIEGYKSIREIRNGLVLTTQDIHMVRNNSTTLYKYQDIEEEIAATKHKVILNISSMHSILSRRTDCVLADKNYVNNYMAYYLTELFTRKQDTTFSLYLLYTLVDDVLFMPHTDPAIYALLEDDGMANYTAISDSADEIVLELELESISSTDLATFSALITDLYELLIATYKRA